MSPDEASVAELEHILRDPGHWIGRTVRIRGTLQASSTEARVIHGAMSIAVDVDERGAARELVSRGVAPYVGGPLLYDHEAILVGTIARRLDGELCLQRVSKITLNPGEPSERTVLIPGK